MPSQTGQKSKVKYFINFHISSNDLVNSTKNAVIFKILAVLQCLVNIPRLRDFYFFLFLPLRGKKRGYLVSLKISDIVNIPNSIFVSCGNFRRDFICLSNHVGCWEATLKIFFGCMVLQMCFLEFLSDYFKQKILPKIPFLSSGTWWRPRVFVWISSGNPPMIPLDHWWPPPPRRGEVKTIGELVFWGFLETYYTITTQSHYKTLSLINWQCL